MKKIFLTFLTLTMLSISTQISKAMTYEEGLKDGSPMVLLIYANWAEDIAKVNNSFVNIQDYKYASEYNFVKMNIASEETKPFNDKYHIYPKLPYILLFKEGGRVTRFVSKDCILDRKCFEQKLEFFAK